MSSIMTISQHIVVDVYLLLYIVFIVLYVIVGKLFRASLVVTEEQAKTQSKCE